MSERTQTIPVEEAQMLDALLGNSPAPAVAVKPAQQDPPSATPPAAEPAVPEETFRSVVQKSLEAKGLKVEVPADIKPEGLADFLAPLLAPKLAPEALELQQAIASGLTVDQYYEQRSAPDRLIAMSDEDLYTTAIKQKYGKSETNPQGWEDEKIQQYIDAKKSNGDLIMLAEDIRIKLREDKAKYTKEMQERAASYGTATESPVQDFNDPKVVEQFTQAVSQASNDIVKEGKLFGLDLGKVEDTKGLNDRIQQLLKPDPKTGKSITDSRIEGNNNYVKMALLLDLAETGKLAKFLDKQGSDFVKSLMTGLELVPGGASGASNVDPNKVDLNRLLRPASSRS